MKPNNALKQERELRGWSQARVAEEIGTTALNVGRWERGTSLPYPHFREKLCKLFGKDARELGLMDDEEGEREAVRVSLPPRTPSGGLISSALYDPAIPLPSPQSAQLVGRGNLLERLKERLCSERTPVLIALHGLPGVGKTALAIALASDADVRTHFYDGILWAGPGLQPDITELLSRWGALLGIEANSAKLESAEDWARAIRTAIGRRRMLLVVDDAWEIATAMAFQVGGPACAFLVTTRYPNLAVQLAAEDALAVPELTDEDGVALLRCYAAAFVEQAPETALALVRSVGGLPLALTLMGKYLSVEVYSGQPRRLLAAVEHLRDARMRLQLSEVRALAERHPSLIGDTPFSLQSIIAVSEQRLGSYALAALRALALFPAKPNSFSEEAALEVCRVPVETLDTLCDAGLLESNGPGRYMLHQTIADYARERLSDPSVAERLVAYYVAFLEKHTGDYELLRREASNVLAALEIAYTFHQREELTRGVCALADFWHLSGLYSLAEKQLLRAYEAAQVPGDYPGLIRVLLYLGRLEQSWGHLDQAEHFLLEGLELAHQREDREQICALLHTIGSVEDARGNFAQAEACFREGLRLARELGLQNLVCRLLSGLGIQAGKRGNFALAEAYFQEGLALARQLAYSERLSAFLHNLGQVAYERGSYARAEGYYQEALTQSEQAGYEVLYASTQVRLGTLALKQGDFARSRAYLEEARQLLGQIGGMHVWLQEALFSLGELEAVEGHDEVAESLLRDCLELARRSGIGELVVQAATELARIEARRGNYFQAEDILWEAQPLAYRLGLNSLIASVLAAWGELNVQRGQPAQALLNFVGMRAVATQEQGEFQALALYGEARAALASGDPLTAHQRGEASLGIFRAMGHYLTAEVEAWLGQLAT